MLLLYAEFNLPLGVLKLASPLDYETLSSYNLTIAVSDGQLNDTATVFVSVTDTNEFSPAFIGGPSFQFHVTEGFVEHHVWQVRYQDPWLVLTIAPH